MMEYEDFLQKKQILETEIGFISQNLPTILFAFQKSIVEWATRRGRAAIFADTGLGKTLMQLAWAEQVSIKTNKPVLIVAPLCVAEQTRKEAEKMGILIKYAREFQSDCKILITNYEMIDSFRESMLEGRFAGIVLDESSILKHESSKTRKKIFELCKNIFYRLSCTATPAPNDYMELGSQAEFLGIMDSVEMLSIFFTHDASETQKWILKGHAKNRFWEWLATWAIYIKKPSDLGFSDVGFDLPKLNIEHVNIGGFWDSEVSGIQGRNKAKTETIKERVLECVKIVNSSREQFIIWCHRNEEAFELHKAISDSVNVSGNDEFEVKKEKIMDFTEGRVRVLISKQKICGFGMNWQHYASPCWNDINQSNTLNARFARQEEDEKHICPLQLDLIFRAIDLWSLKGDVVFSPFAGIGSEGFVAIQNERCFVGIELKESYWRIGKHNLEIAKNMEKLVYVAHGKNIRPSLMRGNYGNQKLSSF